MYGEFFSLRLAQLRLGRNISARDMSQDLKQNKNYINQIENGKAFPSMQAFFSICEYLSITPKDFFDEEKSHPALINEFVGVLETLSEDSTRQLLAVAKTLAQKDQ